jgi:tetratricopeptide (TPR) repeat protein
MAHVWQGLVLATQGRYREAAARNHQALRLDPLSPIVNTNAGFDALRFGDEAEAAARFAVAIEIDPAFAVPYSGMARLHSTRGALADAQRWIDQAIERAPTRAFYLARKGLFLLQVGEDDAAAALIEQACRGSPDNAFDSDLVVALRIVRRDSSALARIGDDHTDRSYLPSQRAQAHLAVGNLAAARALYELQAPDPRHAIDDAINDNWVWRLPHIVNHAHLRVVAGEESGRHDLEQLLVQLDEVRSQGIVNMDLSYWAVSAHAVLGRSDFALQRLDEAIGRGWRHAWWARHDWNMSSLADDSRYRELLRRG